MANYYRLRSIVGAYCIRPVVADEYPTIADPVDAIARRQSNHVYGKHWAYINTPLQVTIADSGFVCDHAD